MYLVVLIPLSPMECGTTGGRSRKENTKDVRSVVSEMAEVQMT
jgi:hypothetical protein